MRTLHRIMDVNHDGVISYDDFKLLAKRFSDLGHLSPEVAAEFEDVIRQTWEEQFGEITPYNLVNAEQFLTDLHHRLNDKKMAKRIGRWLPYLFKVRGRHPFLWTVINAYAVFCLLCRPLTSITLATWISNNTSSSSAVWDSPKMMLPFHSLW